MDVVRKSIEALGGDVDLESKLGEGTTVRVRLPLTLAIIEGLLVEVSNDPFIIPLESVEECIEAPPEAQAGARRLVDLRGAYIPYICLSEYFGGESESRENRQLVILNYSGRRFGFVVDRVIGQHQTVLKKLSPMTRVPGFSGSTVLGNGRVALIVDGEVLLASLGDELEIRPEAA